MLGRGIHRRHSPASVGVVSMLPSTYQAVLHLRLPALTLQLCLNRVVRFAFHISILCVSPVLAWSQETIDFKELVEFACDKSAFYEKVYHYHVDISVEGESNKSFRELRVGMPAKGSSLVPYLLIESVVNPGDPLTDDPHIVSRWEGFDTRVTRRFEREFYDNKHLKMRMNRACVIGQIGPFTRLSDYDPFLNAVFGSPCGVPVTSQRRADPFVVEGILVEVDNHEAWGRIFKVKRPDLPMTKIVYSDQPGSLLIGRSDEAFHMQTDSFRLFEGLKIPERGLMRVDYKGTSRASNFELMSVEHCSVSSDSWFPALPTGTAFIDYTNDRVSMEPRTAEENRLIYEYGLNRSRSLPGWSWRRIIMVLLNVIIALFAVLYLQRRRGSV